ncbi:MAG: phosphotransferase [Caldilineaceae bacterium]
MKPADASTQPSLWKHGALRWPRSTGPRAHFVPWRGARRLGRGFRLAQADTLLPPDDDVTRDELAQIAAALRTLPQTDATYGMTHGDFGPQNFRYDPVHGITAFDFGNCGYHWYLWDIAVASARPCGRTRSIRRGSGTHLGGLCCGLSGRAGPARSSDWFLRLRMIIVYLSRLCGSASPGSCATSHPRPHPRQRAHPRSLGAGCRADVARVNCLVSDFAAITQQQISGAQRRTAATPHA